MDPFVVAGFGVSEAERRLALVRRTAAAHRRTAERPPMAAWFVPGRIEIFGKHTDYAGGASLVCAVPRGFAVTASPRTDGRVSVVDARWDDRATVVPGDTTRRLKGWGNYVAVVAHRLALNFPGAPLGADLTVASDLPRAAGLSSSSAFVVALALALARRAGLEARPEWAASLPSRLELAGYLGAVENGLGFGALAGTSGVGTHGGSEDHTAILASSAEHVAAFRYMPVRAIGSAPMPEDWRFVIMTSGVHADKAGSVRGRYNRASLATRALVSLASVVSVGAAPGQPATTLADILVRPDAEARLREALRDLPSGGAFTAGELQARLTHFVREHGRVPQALAAFRDASAVEIGDLADASQAEAASLLGNQVSETIALAAAARSRGAIAASSFGAGFGGSVWALIRVRDAADVTTFAHAWRDRYLAEIPITSPIEWFAARPGPAAFEVPVDALSE